MHRQYCNFSSLKMVSWPNYCVSYNCISLTCAAKLFMEFSMFAVSGSFPLLPLKPNPVWLVSLLLHQICHWQDHQRLPCCQIWWSILSPCPGWTVSSIVHNLSSSSLVPFLPSALRTPHTWFFSFSLFTPSQFSFLPPPPLTISEGWRPQGSVLGPLFLSIFPWLYPVLWLQMPSIYQWLPNLHLQLGLFSLSLKTSIPSCLLEIPLGCCIRQETLSYVLLKMTSNLSSISQKGLFLTHTTYLPCSALCHHHSRTQADGAALIWNIADHSERENRKQQTINWFLKLLLHFIGQIKS